jgi:hypothetical protein
MDTVLTTARVMALAMAMGAVLLWGVAWFLVGRGGGGMARTAFLGPKVALEVWGVAAAGGLIGALALRGRAVRAGREARRAGAEDAWSVAAKVQGSLLVAWALLEGPGVLAGVFYLLFGYGEIVVLAAPVLAVGVALTFPRREWFEGR